MGYEELYEKYQKLLEENKKLRSENEDYQKQLGLVLPIFSREVQNEKEVDRISSDLVNNFEQVTNDSSPEDKIKLFMSIFRGRTDVYAKRWLNREGKSGYSPVCLNEWETGICMKPKVKCSNCGNKDYGIYDSQAVDKHLRGKAVFGVYPLLPDETCHFLAIDFDDDVWQKDIITLRNI